MRDGDVAVGLQPQPGAEAPQARGLMLQMGFGSTHVPDASSSSLDLCPGSGTSARCISPPYLVLLDGV